MLVRFPDQADFFVNLDTLEVGCRPVPAVEDEILDSLFVNSICPLVANHRGQLNLHGSAVSCMGHGVAFLGMSGLGKTTLAAAFAQQGHQFIAEDILDIGEANGRFELHSRRPIIRLFEDSAAAIMGKSKAASFASFGTKLMVPVDAELSYAKEPCPLSALFFLEKESVRSPVIKVLSPANALTRLCQNTFILDVEDKPRLARHFDQLGDLAARIPCFVLDYERKFEALPAVMDSVMETTQGLVQ